MRSEVMDLSRSVDHLLDRKINKNQQSGMYNELSCKLGTCTGPMRNVNEFNFQYER